jgi:transposase
MDTFCVDRIEAVADRGYFKIEDIEACEEAGITAYVPKPIRGPAVAEGFFSKEQFRYNRTRTFTFPPADQVLSPRHFGKSRDNVKIDYVTRPDKAIGHPCVLHFHHRRGVKGRPPTSNQARTR